jgi:hypothetical protein
VTQLASAAFVDAIEAIAANQQCEIAFASLDDHASDNKKHIGDGEFLRRDLSSIPPRLA